MQAKAKERLIDMQVCSVIYDDSERKSKDTPVKA